MLESKREGSEVVQEGSRGGILSDPDLIHTTNIGKAQERNRVLKKASINGISGVASREARH